MRSFALLIGAPGGGASWESWEPPESWVDELPPVEIVHGQRRGVRGDLGEVLLLALDLRGKRQLSDALLDGLDQRAHEPPPHPRPVGDLADERLARLADEVRRRPDAALALAADEDVDEIGVERQLDRRARLARRLIELGDGLVHL